MNALFIFRGRNLDGHGGPWKRFLVSVPDGPHDRYELAVALLRKEYRELEAWQGDYVCLTPDRLLKEL